MRRTPWRLAAALLAPLLGAGAQSATVAVDFRLTELESSTPVAGAEVLLLLGDAAVARQAAAGQRFVTDGEGRARLTLPAVQIERRWISVPLAQTGISLPRRVDHLPVAVVLDQALPQADGRVLHQPWLHRLDIDCLDADTCSTSDITAAWAPDAGGDWARPVHYGQPSPQLPELGGLVLSTPAYRCADFLLTPLSADRSRWSLRLWLQRRPLPVRR